MKKNLKKIVAPAMAAVLSAGIFGGVNAVPTMADDVITNYTSENKPNIAITKALSMGKGTPTDDMEAYTYSFRITQDVTAGGKIPDGGTGEDVPINRDSVIIGTPVDGVNHTGEVKVTVDPENATADGGIATKNGDTITYSTRKSSNDTTDFYKAETYNILDGVTFANEGVYVYTISEYDITSPEFKGKTYDEVAVGEYAESLTMSKAEYEMRVYTTKDENDQIYVWAVTVGKTVDDDGTVIPDDEVQKINPESGANGELSDLEIINSYSRTLKTDENDDKNKPYVISKKVQGLPDNANQGKILLGDETENRTGADTFKFTVTLTKGDGIAYTKDKYEAYVLTSKNGVDYEKGNIKYEFEFNDDGVATQDVVLGHYQKLAFEDQLPAGTGYEVEEWNYTGTGDNQQTTTSGNTYTPSVNGSAEGVVADSGVVSATPGLSKSDYINDAKTGTTPAGILTNYMPFFIILGAGIAGIVAIAVVKGRRRGSETE